MNNVNKTRQAYNELRWQVYNKTHGYVEHVGSHASCERYIQNANDLFLIGDEFEIQVGK